MSFSPMAAWAYEQPFGLPLPIGSFSDPVTVEMVDLDRDGRLDILAAGAEGIAWWRFDGVDWTRTNVAATATTAIAIGDVDRDGDADVVAASAAGLTLYRNDGDGASWTAAAIEAGVAAAGIAVGDIDGDGALDVAATLATTVEWWRNSAGDASIWSRQVMVADPGPRGIAAADFDRDGDLDFAIGTASTTYFGYLRNDSPGFTRFTIAVGSSTPPTITTVVDAGDLDGNGYPDVAIYDPHDDEYHFLWNDGTPDNGGWTRRSFSGNPDLRGFEIADVDRDGRLDLAIANGTTARWIERQENPPDYNLVSRPLPSIGVVTALGFGDLDGDGDRDAVAADAGGDRLVWLLNHDLDISLEFRPAVDASPFDGARDLESADLDRDGDLDLLAAAFDGDEVAWLENAGGAWTRHAVGPLDGATSVTSADLDGDGDLDLLATGAPGDTIAWWRNDLPGSFTRFDVATNLDGARDLAAADLDADGDPDVVACGDAGDRLVAYLNGGPGTFGTVDISTTFDAPAAMAIGDLDGDGDPDVAAFSALEMAWWANAGDGASWTFHSIDIEPLNFAGPSRVEIVDVDGDGHNDVLATAEGSLIAHLWTNTAGDGSTWAETTFWHDGVRDATAVDLDRDGDLDLAVAGTGSTGRLSYFLYDPDSGGSGWIGPWHVESGLAGAAAVVAGDFDRDGLPDLAVAAEVADLVRVRFHGGGQYTLAAQTLVDPLPPLAETCAFQLDLTPRGQPGDTNVELSRVSIQVANHLGPLTSFDAGTLNQRILRLEILRDNPTLGVVGSCDDEDLEAAGFDVVPVDGFGVMNLGVADGTAAASVPQGGTGRFFVKFFTGAMGFASATHYDFTLASYGVQDRDFDVVLRRDQVLDAPAATFPMNTSADGRVLVEEDTDPVSPGSLLTYIVSTTSLGPHGVVDPVVVVELPAEVDVVQSPPSCAEGAPRTFTCDIAGLGFGSTWNSQFQVIVHTDATGPLVATATLSHYTPDPNPANNSAQAVTFLVGTIFADGFESGSTGAWSQTTP